MKMKLDDEPIVEIQKGEGYSPFGREGQRGSAKVEYIVDSEDEERCVLRITSIEKASTKPTNSGDAMRDYFMERGEY